MSNITSHSDARESLRWISVHNALWRRSQCLYHYDKFDQNEEPNWKPNEKPNRKLITQSLEKLFFENFALKRQDRHLVRDADTSGQTHRRATERPFWLEKARNESAILVRPHVAVTISSGVESAHCVNGEARNARRIVVWIGISRWLVVDDRNLKSCKKKTTILAHAREDKKRRKKSGTQLCDFRVALGLKVCMWVCC